MTLQLLSHSRKKANGKIYKYYSIAESYWEDKNNKKKILFYLGSLTPPQVKQIRNILKVAQSLDAFTATFDDLCHWRLRSAQFWRDKKSIGIKAL